jgi:hypothetical protein
MSTLPVDIFDRDWRRELAGGALAEHLRRWRELEPALWPFTRPVALVRYLGPSTPAARKDEVLCALLRCARRDPLAARLILQALLPALKRRVGLVLIDADERDELWSAVLYRAWWRIRGYPIGRLPRYVAANLALSAVRDGLRMLEKDRDGAATGEPAPEPVDRDPAEGDIDALLKRAVRDGAITEAEAELIVQTRIDGVALVDYPFAEGRAYDALRLCRRRAERRLALYLGTGNVERRVFGLGGRNGLSVVLGSSGEGPTGLSGEKTNRHP